MADNPFMRKKLHFVPKLVPLVLSGEKTITWKFWDDKNLSKGDLVDFLESKTERHFVTAELTEVLKKPMGKLTKEDKEGHEKFKSEKEMYETYSKYYKQNVNPETIVKIIKFELTEELTEEQKLEIEESVKKTIKEYGETLKLLGSS